MDLGVGDIDGLTGETVVHIVELEERKLFLKKFRGYWKRPSILLHPTRVLYGMTFLPWNLRESISRRQFILTNKSMIYRSRGFHTGVFFLWWRYFPEREKIIPLHKIQEVQLVGPERGVLFKGTWKCLVFTSANGMELTIDGVKDANYFKKLLTETKAKQEVLLNDGSKGKDIQETMEEVRDALRILTKFLKGDKIDGRDDSLLQERNVARTVPLSAELYEEKDSEHEKESQGSESDSEVHVAPSVPKYDPPKPSAIQEPVPISSMDAQPKLEDLTSQPMPTVPIPSLPDIPTLVSASSYVVSTPHLITNVSNVSTPAEVYNVSRQGKTGKFDSPPASDDEPSYQQPLPEAPPEDDDSEGEGESQYTVSGSGSERSYSVASDDPSELDESIREIQEQALRILST